MRRIRIASDCRDCNLQLKSRQLRWYADGKLAQSCMQASAVTFVAGKVLPPLRVSRRRMYAHTLRLRTTLLSTCKPYAHTMNRATHGVISVAMTGVWSVRIALVRPHYCCAAHSTSSDLTKRSPVAVVDWDNCGVTIQCHVGPPPTIQPLCVHSTSPVP